MMTAISSYHWFYDVNTSQGTVAMRMRSVKNFAKNLPAQRYASANILAVVCSSIYTSVTLCVTRWYCLKMAECITNRKEARRSIPSVWQDRSCSTRVRRPRCLDFDSNCWHPRRLLLETSDLCCSRVSVETVTSRPDTLCHSPLPTCSRGTAFLPVLGCSPHHLYAYTCHMIGSVNQKTESISNI